MGESEVTLKSVLRIEEGFSCKAVITEHDHKVKVIESLNVEVHDKTIRIALDEDIKVLIAGFIACSQI